MWTFTQVLECGMLSPTVLCVELQYCLAVLSSVHCCISIQKLLVVLSQELFFVLSLSQEFIHFIVPLPTRVCICELELMLSLLYEYTEV